jgi:hypothetical protein
MSDLDLKIEHGIKGAYSLERTEALTCMQRMRSATTFMVISYIVKTGIVVDIKR